MNIEAQQFLLAGNVFNAKLEPLSYVTVQIKQLQIGTKTDDRGHFEFKLEEGEYEIFFSLLGYKKQSIKCILRSGSKPERIILESNESSLNEVRVISFKKDRAEEIIKEVIRRKSKITEAVQSYSVAVYIRATQEDSKQLSAKQIRKMSDSAKQVLASKLPNMAMAEIALQLDYSFPNKTKETRNAVNIRGNSESLFYLRTTDGDFSLYNNLIKVPSLSQVPMLSPISYSGLVAYKFKTKNISKKEAYSIYTIQFSPTTMGNALVDGEVDIVDTSWTIVRSSFTFPKFHMPEYNYFQVNQTYDFVDSKAWLLNRQEFIYRIKEGRTSSSGRTLVVYDDYKIDTLFAKKYFNNELSSTALNAYDKDSTFWTTSRKEPLNEHELRYIIQSDSIQRVHTSKPYLDSIDKRHNKLTFPRIAFFGMEHYNRKRDETIYFNPIISVVRPFFPGGTRIAYGMDYNRIFTSKKNIRVSADINYGIRNSDFQGGLTVSHLYNPFSRAYASLVIGRSFDFIYQGDAFINLFRRSNFYIRNTAIFTHGRELINGLYLTNYIEFAKRSSINSLQFGRQFDSLYAINNNAIDFSAYNIFYLSMRLSYTPHQLYVREPHEKIVLGSNYPTFYAYYRKGIPAVFNSSINFDYLEFGMQQVVKLGLGGSMRYEIYTGDFLSQKKLLFIDYKFIRRGDPFLFSNPMRSFQTMDSSFNIFHRFYQGHILHEFNGAILNKIPLLKKLNLLEVVGGGLLILPERNLQFAEAFAGIEKIVPLWREKFKIGIYITGSAANKYNNPYQFKIGLGQFNKKSNSWF
jgi:hypothetical protein